MSSLITITEKDQQEGSPHAPLVLVEYGDYQCPYCGAAYPGIKKLQRFFGSDLLFVFRNFPLPEIHPHAITAAYAAEAAGLQNKFWPMHDLIFENQENITLDCLLNFARAIGADVEKLLLDMTTPRIINKVDADVETGLRNAVNGTPTLFINGKRHNGSYEFDVVRDEMVKLL